MTFAEPSLTDFLLMFNALIILGALLFWTKFIPRAFQARMEFSNMVRKGWLMMENDNQRIAFTRLMVEAMKSDGKVTEDEGAEMYEEMTKEVKVKASQMKNSEMISILLEMKPESKVVIFKAIEQVLKSDGIIDPVEHIWFADIMNKIN